MMGRMLLAAASAAVMLMSGAADAARWCHGGPHAKGCIFQTRTACVAATQRGGGDCHRQVVAQRPTAAPSARGMAPGQVYPSRPAGSSPYECFMDDGYGRFRPCSGGDLP